MSVEKENDKLAPYKAHGVRFRIEKGEAKGDCPFCGKERHFFVSSKTGQYRCMVSCCDESTGNIYSFLQKIHDVALEKTKKSDYERLSSLRDGMPWQIFRDRKLAFNKATGRWLLPMNNHKGNLANLCMYGPPKTPSPISTTGCALHLYYGDEIKPSGPIYICEGPWDAMSLQWLFEKNNIDPSLWSVVGCPGTVFKKEWFETYRFKGRDVFLLFDKDTAGSTAMDRIQELFANKSNVKRIQWPSELPDKYDVRDYITHRADKPKKALDGLLALFPEKNAAPGKPKPKLVRDTFQSVLKDFRKVIHTDKAWEDAAAVCAATVVAGSLKNDPLWMFLVGPPGSGKTLLVESFINCPDMTIYMSKITRPALVSGFRGEEDYSVLDKLPGKCLIVKDFTAILGMPMQAQLEIFGILRDVFDGHCVVPFGNMEPKVYKNCHFSNISAVTDAIRKYNLADLGERFLKMELLDEATHDPDKHVMTALSAIEDDISQKAAQEEFLRDSVAAFMSRPFDEKKLPKLPEWLKIRLASIAQLCAYIRAVVAKTGGDLSYRPRPEIGTRLAKQLAKLSRCLCWVLDKKKIDEEVYRLVAKVACDTILGWDLEIIHALYSVGDKGLTLPDIGNLMQLSHSGIDRRLENLQHLGLVHRTAEVRRDGRGRRYFIWHLTDKIRDYWRNAALHYAPPPVVKHQKRNGYKPKGAKPSKPDRQSKTPIKRMVRRGKN